MSLTLDIGAAAAFLGIHRETLRERAAAGMIPGAKIGKEWRFLQDDLTAYFRSQCRSFAAPAAPTGGSTSGTLAAEELDALLRRPTKTSRSDSTTNLRLVSGRSSNPAASSPTPSSRGRKRKSAEAAT